MVSEKLRLKLNLLGKKFNLDLFILFGSRAKSTNQKDSDWDFAILPGKNFEKKDYITLREELYDLTNSEKVDLIDIEEQDNPILRFEIFESGICLFEKKENLFEENKTNSWFNYLYFKPEIDLRNQQIKKSLKEMI